MKINIIKAEINDAKRIAPLFDQYRQFYRQPSDLSAAENFLTERLSNNESIVYFAEDDQNNILGFTQLYPCFSSVSVCSKLILNDLFVEESARGLGIAKLLIEAAKGCALERGDKRLSLQTATDNLIAQKFYSKMDFHLVEDFVQYSLTIIE
ncbi:GNAT family N-acetyltransferase [Thalassotalea marina]|uniref:N-acetyltransferase n=1 Tax=Thalassotalea marina TaxID=1673741 RepID=A0A919BJG1_9GAMM|nr:GNAT family N-acetyltransferase [Thalassotalea marina]GHF91887.1 N-acetyltransferase [Thalassotalea marina]